MTIQPLPYYLWSGLGADTAHAAPPAGGAGGASDASRASSATRVSASTPGLRIGSRSTSAGSLRSSSSVVQATALTAGSNPTSPGQRALGWQQAAARLQQHSPPRPPPALALSLGWPSTQLVATLGLANSPSSTWRAHTPQTPQVLL
jgi:hypothetical protein